MTKQHIPVMRESVIDVLKPQIGDVYMDLTAGYGGHAELVLKLIGKSGRAYLFDQDDEAIAALQTKFQNDPRVQIVKSNFASIDWELLPKADMILADLGVSSVQLDEAKRGFSFKQNGPLDMRMDTSSKVTVADLVNNADEKVLADIIFKYGEEPKSRRIARAICAEREKQAMKTTQQLADVVRSQFPKGYYRIDPATKTFQALRIAVNNELEKLEYMLDVAMNELSPGGRMAIISFHSLEDRIIKRKMRDMTRDVCDNITGQALQESEYRLVTKKPIIPAPEEIAYNPRARSAKLRAVEKKK
jgi:16S rRNA (cytosine1402-N4)-methyltransferase